MKNKIKSFFKKIFPLVFLRKIQLEVNKLKILTFDKIVYPEEKIDDSDYLINRVEFPFELIKVKTAHLDQRLRNQFEKKNKNWTQDEYLLIYDKPCLIEPEYGWALSTNNNLIYPSLGFSRALYLHKPSLLSKKINLNYELKTYDELISLRDTGEENYFHFYNDVLVKLFFLEDKIKISKDVPILISKKLFEKKYFQYFFQHPYLKNRTWVIQDKDYIRSNKTYFCKPLTHSKQFYERVLNIVKEEDLNFAKKDRRVFITRTPARLRYIENNVEIERVCKEYGFEIVDFDILTLPQQIKIMAESRFVIGIHGAGLVNMLFRQNYELGMIEIYPPSDYFPFHYILLANQLGFYYDGIIGCPGSEKYSGGFIVDTLELRSCIEKMINM